MNILLDEINKEAKCTYDREITVENYEHWVQHWIDTAESMANKYKLAGLEKTAEALKEHADFAREWVLRDKK